MKTSLLIRPAGVLWLARNRSASSGVSRPHDASGHHSNTRSGSAIAPRYQGGTVVEQTIAAWQWLWSSPRLTNQCANKELQTGPLVRIAPPKTDHSMRLR